MGKELEIRVPSKRKKTFNKYLYIQLQGP